MPPLVSIIIPIYNVEAYLRACLDSVIAQTEPRFECLMVDDGSTDSSAAIAAEVSAADSRFRLIRQPENRGQSAARNAGLDEARGEYIVFVDSDDTIASEFLEFHLKRMEETGADIVMTDTTRRLTLGSAEATALCLYQRKGVNPSVYGKMYRAGLFEGIRFRPGIIYEDLELMPRLWKRARLIECYRRPMYAYRHRPGSSINSFTPARLDALTVTAGIEAAHRADPLLGPAAADRRLSACFNILLLLSANGMDRSPRADECWAEIRRLRLRSLFNPRVRLKNKAGIIASLLLPRSVLVSFGKKR